MGRGPSPYSLKGSKYYPLKTLEGLSWKQRFVIEGLILGQSTEEIAESTKYSDCSVSHAIILRTIAGMYREAQLGPMPRTGFYGRAIQWAADRGLTKKAVQTGVLEVADADSPEPAAKPAQGPDMLLGKPRAQALESQQTRLAARRAAMEREAKARAERKDIKALQKKQKHDEAMEKVERDRLLEIEKRRNLPKWSKFYLPPEPQS
jgi:hypothetical protein